MAKDKLIVPEKHLIGIKYPEKKSSVSEDEGDEVNVPQAFMIPWATKPDKAMEKRKETVESWLNGWGGNKNTNKTEIFDNVPMTGFQLADVNRRYRTNNALWNVTDPRGFDIELSIENLSWMLTKVTIERGLIIDEMVWVKWKSQAYNLLVPTSDPDYQLALQNTADLKVKKVMLKENEVSVGQKVTLLNEEQVTYMGRAKVKLTRTFTSYSNRNHKPLITDTKTSEEFFVVREIINSDYSSYRLYRSFPKIISAGKQTDNTQLPIVCGNKSWISLAGNGNLYPTTEEEMRDCYYREEALGFVV